MARKVPEINAGSMADIAFLLLIFFLMATTMSVDSGMSRLLPPMPDSKANKSKSPEIKKRNVFVVLVNKYDQLLVNGEPLDIQLLRNKTKEFIVNPLNNPALSEKKTEEIYGLGLWPVSKGIISLQSDRRTSYKMYLSVQNELVASHNELRNEFAQTKFGKKYGELSADEQRIVRAVYPQQISEAEPKSVK